MSRFLGMIAALLEYGPPWLFRTASPFADLLRRMARRQDAFDDGYDRIADQLVRRARHDAL